MRITQTWKRNDPRTCVGESITLTVIYSSFSKDEIDELEAKMPKGTITMEWPKEEEDNRK